MPSEEAQGCFKRVVFGVMDPAPFLLTFHAPFVSSRLVMTLSGLNHMASHQAGFHPPRAISTINSIITYILSEQLAFACCLVETCNAVRAVDPIQVCA